jgi:hypothetical protein
VPHVRAQRLRFDTLYGKRFPGQRRGGECSVADFTDDDWPEGYGPAPLLSKPKIDDLPPGCARFRRRRAGPDAGADRRHPVRMARRADIPARNGSTESTFYAVS